MPQEPQSKKVHVFVDGQNLFHGVKAAFGYRHPNYDFPRLAAEVCGLKGWSPEQVHFYTGVHTAARDPEWHRFWTAKTDVMGTRGVTVFKRDLRYTETRSTATDGTTTVHFDPREKGVDIRIALDIVRLAREGAFDVAVVFSQDQDLSEVADEVRRISIGQDRWIKIASAFPFVNGQRNWRGIERTEWLPFDKALYDGCIDPIDYRSWHKKRP